MVGRYRGRAVGTVNTTHGVIPAKAGISFELAMKEIPACAGMPLWGRGHAPVGPQECPTGSLLNKTFPFA